MLADASQSQMFFGGLRGGLSPRRARGVDKVGVGLAVKRRKWKCEHSQAEARAGIGASGTAHGDFGECVAVSPQVFAVFPQRIPGPGVL